MGWETYDPHPPDGSSLQWLIMMGLSVVATVLLWTL